ncbi:hypothetical protein EXIGLDRAFT_724280 [Exidia glandulosa HHB12029]|uniref:F-box domain-containing protein n=1 Tax=Exidia glandulosa HHB12029 TaxID=1314781 RepID=A0A165MTE6_EXIGL|nr:hypothetical protein EXIGLDRAFT_724280 [Exidia glandulosa HHB12029]
MNSGDVSMTIDLLPDELVLAIVREASLGPLRIGAVCSRWRQIGLTDKSLWTKISLDDSRADESLIKAEYFVARAGSLRLTINRRGAGPDEESASRIDNYVLALLPRCRSYEHSYIPDQLHRVAFIKALLSAHSSTLEELELASHQALEVSFTDQQAIPVIADHFPRLSSIFIVGVCLPLSQMLVSSQCTTVFDYHDCEGSCQHDEAFGEEIDRIVSALPTLRVLKADHQYGLLFDSETEVTMTGYFHLFEALVTLSFTIEELGVTGVPTVWPSLRQLETVSLPRLTELRLAGRLVVPHVCQDENNPSPTDSVDSVLPLLQLLVAARNLIVLNLQLWYSIPSGTAPLDFPVIDLPRLEEVYFREVHEVYAKRIFVAIRAPRLRSLTLADTVRDDDTAYELGEVMNAWDLPCLEVFRLSSLADDSIGDLTFPALALGRMLRDGHLPRLQRLEVSSPGWVTELHLRDAIDAIRDPNVAPSLLILQVSNSSPPVHVGRVKGAERERNARLGSRRLTITLLSGYASHEHDEDRRIGGENDVAPEAEDDSADVDIE